MTRFTRLALMTAAGIAVGAAFAQADMLQKVGAGEGRSLDRRLAGLHRARRKRQGL